MASAKTVPLTPDAVILPLDQVEEDPNNARRTFDPASLKALAASIKEQGQLVPAVVRTLPDGKMRLVDGHRRFRACQLAGVPLRAEVLEADDATAALMAATANLQRDDLTPYEEARAYKAILDLLKAAGKKSNVAEVARLCGKAHNTVKHRLELLDLPEIVAQRIGVDGFSIQHAQAVLPFKAAPKLLEAAAEFASTTKTIGHADDFGDAISRELHKQKLLANKHNVDRYWDLRTLDKRLEKVASIEVDGSPEYTDIDAFDQAVAAAKADLAASNKKTAAPASSPKKQNEAKRLEARALELARNKQVELLEAHVGKLGKWTDDLQRQLILGYLHHARGASRNDDIAAGERITGLTRDQERLLTLDWEARDNPEKVRKLFKDHGDKIRKLVAVRLFFDRQAHDGISVGQRYLNIPHVAAPKDKLLTGKSYDDVLDDAKQAVKDEADVKRKKAKGGAKCSTCGSMAMLVTRAGVAKCAPCWHKTEKKPKGKPSQDDLKAAKKAAKAKQSARDKAAAKKGGKVSPAVAKARAKLASAKPKAEKGKQAQLPKAQLVVDEASSPEEVAEAVVAAVADSQPSDSVQA